MDTIKSFTRWVLDAAVSIVLYPLLRHTPDTEAAIRTGLVQGKDLIAIQPLYEPSQFYVDNGPIRTQDAYAIRTTACDPRRYQVIHVDAKHKTIQCTNVVSETPSTNMYVTDPCNSNGANEFCRQRLDTSLQLEWWGWGMKAPLKVAATTLDTLLQGTTPLHVRYYPRDDPKGSPKELAALMSLSATFEDWKEVDRYFMYQPMGKDNIMLILSPTHVFVLERPDTMREKTRLDRSLAAVSSLWQTGQLQFVTRELLTLVDILNKAGIYHDQIQPYHLTWTNALRLVDLRNTFTRAAMFQKYSVQDDNTGFQNFLGTREAAQAAGGKKRTKVKGKSKAKTKAKSKQRKGGSLLEKKWLEGTVCPPHNDVLKHIINNTWSLGHIRDVTLLKHALDELAAYDRQTLSDMNCMVVTGKVASSGVQEKTLLDMLERYNLHQAGELLLYLTMCQGFGKIPIHHQQVFNKLWRGILMPRSMGDEEDLFKTPSSIMSEVVGFKGGRRLKGKRK